MEPLKIIKHALDTTISLIRNGESPTVALEKVARELDLNPNYIQRTGEALNVALTYDHFKKNASDKAADFDIANTETATKNIFGAQDKTLAQKKAEWFPKVKEDIDYNKYLANPGFKKKAHEIKKTNANFDSFDISYKGQYKKAAEHMDRLDREMDVMKTEKVANDVYIENAFFNLVSSFKKEASARTPFHEFESQVYAQHGERAVPYIDLIYKSAELKEERGRHDDKYMAFTPVREALVFDSFLKAAAAKVQHEVEVKEAEAYINEQKTRFREIGYKLNPIAQAFDKVACDQLDEALDKIGEEIEKVAVGDIGKGLITDLYNQFIDRSKGSDKSKPIYENTKLDNRDRTAILQELIMTDPILMKQDPRKIISAYQQVLRLAPHLSKEKEVVRAQLRAMMAGQALHPTDAGQLVNVNTDIMKQQKELKSTSDSKDDDKKGKH